MRRPPGLAAKTVAVTFITVAIILSIVFIVLIVDARDRMRTAETTKLEASARIFTAFEARRDRDQLATTATLAENPTLKAAFDTYTTEAHLASNYEQRLEAQQTGAREAGSGDVGERARDSRCPEPRVRQCRHVAATLAGE